MYLCSMNDERLSRHLQNENADLKSENSRLKMLTEPQENKIQEIASEPWAKSNFVEIKYFSNFAQDFIH